MRETAPMPATPPPDGRTLRLQAAPVAAPCTVCGGITGYEAVEHGAGEPVARRPCCPDCLSGEAARLQGLRLPPGQTTPGAAHDGGLGPDSTNQHSGGTTTMANATLPAGQAATTWAHVRGIGLLGDEPVMLLTVPAWDPERLVAIPEQTLPAVWQEQLAAGLRLPVDANLTAACEADLHLTVLPLDGAPGVPA